MLDPISCDVVVVWPIICHTVAKASSLLSSQVIVTVLVAVVGVGITILLKVDNLPCDVVPIVSLVPFVVLRGSLRDGIGCVTVWAVLLIIVVGIVQA